MVKQALDRVEPVELGVGRLTGRVGWCRGGLLHLNTQREVERQQEEQEGFHREKQGERGVEG